MPSSRLGLLGDANMVDDLTLKDKAFGVWKLAGLEDFFNKRGPKNTVGAVFYLAHLEYTVHAENWRETSKVMSSYYGFKKHWTAWHKAIQKWSSSVWDALNEASVAYKRLYRDKKPESETAEETACQKKAVQKTSQADTVSGTAEETACQKKAVQKTSQADTVSGTAEETACQKKAVQKTSQADTVSGTAEETACQKKAVQKTSQADTVSGTAEDVEGLDGDVLAAIDGTGFSRTNASHHYLRRIDSLYKIKRNAQVVLMVDVKRRTFLSWRFRAKPRGEILDVKYLIRTSPVKPELVLMDKGFDSNPLHEWLRNNNIWSIAPVRKRMQKRKIPQTTKRPFRLRPLLAKKHRRKPHRSRQKKIRLQPQSTNSTNAKSRNQLQTNRLQHRTQKTKTFYKAQEA